MAAVYNFRVDQGSTKRFSLIYKDSEGNLKPLDGYQVAGQIRFKASDEIPLAEFLFEVFPLESRIDVILPASALQGKPIKGRNYSETMEAFYDIEISNGDEVIRLLNGTIQISPEITK